MKSFVQVPGFGLPVSRQAQQRHMIRKVFATPFRALAAARWTVIDQGISSASNLIFVVSVARTSDVAEFGAFSLAYLSYGLLLGIGRAMGGDILLLRSEQHPDQTEHDARRLLGVVSTLGLAAGLVACAMGVLASGAFGISLLAFGAVMPILLMQDGLRYCLFARRTPALAAATDLTWLVIQVIATSVLLHLAPQAGPASIVLAWATGAAVALGVGLRKARLTPSFHRVTAWFTEDRARVSSFSSDFAMQSGTTYAWAYLIAVIGKVEDVAAVRGSILLFSPLDALFVSIRVVTLPALARQVAQGSAALRRHAQLVALVSAALAIGWSAAALGLPDEIGRAALGATWEVVTPIIIPIALASIARYVSIAPQTGLWALGDTRLIVRLRITATLIVLASVTLGTVAAGALGAAIGLAVASLAQSILFWQGFQASSRRLPAYTPQSTNGCD